MIYLLQIYQITNLLICFHENWTKITEIRGKRNYRTKK